MIRIIMETKAGRSSSKKGFPPMNNKLPLLAAFFIVFILGASHPWQNCLADSSDDDEGTQKTYYWQGNQLNNLGRLANPADFEEEQRRTREGKDADQYLASVRNQMAHQAQKNAEEKTALAFQGQMPGDPIELTALS